MAFQNVIFPTLKLKHGAYKEISDPVSITGNGTRELRRKQNRWERFIWTIPSRHLIEADKLAIHKFLRGVNMGLDSFLFQDPTCPELLNAPLKNRSTNTWYLNIPYDSTTPGTHPIMNPRMSGLVFKKNGVTVTATYSGVDTAGFPYVTITGSVPTDTITVTGSLYMTVRFNGTLGYTITAMEKSSLGGTCQVVPTVVQLADFQLVEVFER